MHLVTGMTGIRKHQTNVIWGPGSCILTFPGCDLGVLGDQLGDPEVPRTPNRTPWALDIDFNPFLVDLGIPLEPTLDSFWRRLCDLDYEI